MTNCIICNSKLGNVVMNFDSKVIQEIGSDNFQFERVYKECPNCLCFQSSLIETESNNKCFSEEYYEKVDTENLGHKFDRVMKMNRNQSDNIRRVERIHHYLKYYQENFQISSQKELLDIGSGTGVFPAKFLELSPDWDPTVLEPDKIACEHLQKVITKATVIHGFLEPNKFQDNQFDLITLNRCLEHMPNPLEVLKVTHNVLKDNGLIYIEVPDTITLFINDRFDDAFGDAHLFIFSPESLNFAIKASGFTLLSSGRTKEPSGKYTAFAFATKNLF